jgi:thiol-disulfide isomerase/thioredoxin
LDNTGTKTNEERSKYTIEVWTASWCGPCRRYKLVELPALLKTGCKVTVRDYDKDNPPKDVKKVPTVRVYFKGSFLRQEPYWRAKDVTEYIDNHLSLKG